MALNARRPTLRLRKAGLDAAVEVTFDQTLATLLKSDVLARATRQSPSHHLVLLLIRCWAARRGLCGQRRGFPSGYAFGLMVANHWQSLGMLPLSPRSRESLSAWGGAQAAPVEPLNMEDVDRHMVAGLFSAFFRFYGFSFQWRKEAVSVRSVSRSKSSPLLWVEDPLEPGVDLAGPYLNSWRNARLFGELRRCGRQVQHPGVTF